MMLVFWLMHRLSWQDGLMIWGDISKVNVFMMAAMVRLGIEFTAPVQPVTMAPPAMIAPSLHLTAGEAHNFDSMWNGSTAMPGWSCREDQAPEVSASRAAAPAPAAHGTVRVASVAQAGAGPDATPQAFVRLPYDDGLARQNAHRDVKVQQFDAKRFAEDFVDVRTGPVASTWTWKLSYTDRARQALHRRYADTSKLKAEAEVVAPHA
jgi:hypothetical protein